jgi:hypothetical protein
MKWFASLSLLVCLSVGFAEEPKQPTPQKEHDWLKQLDGEWLFESECTMEPGKPPVKCKGTETVRTLGGFWSISEMKGDFMGSPFTGVMTLGFDTQKKRYVGTWLCSMCETMSSYDGSLDKDAKVLTLETEAPHPATGKLVKMRDVLEVKDKNHKVLKSYLQEDGKWVPFMSATYTRK